MYGNSLQMWNLLKVFNKDQYLEGLKSIDEVYDVQVNMFEEITNYHANRDKLVKKDILDKSDSKDSSSDFSEMNEDESPNIREEKIKNIYNKID
jgi:hypothetical protein